MIELDPRTSALLLVDLQQGILGNRTLAPRSGDEVMATSRTLATRFREAGAVVVLIRVGFSQDLRDLPSQLVDTPRPMKTAPPPEFTALAEGLAEPTDLIVTKRQWGAFYGTELELQLRRRGIKTVAVGGIATNFGVESTVRDAWEHGYHVVVVEDACASMSPELHAFPLQHVFPRVARVTTAADIVLIPII